MLPGSWWHVQKTHPTIRVHSLSSFLLLAIRETLLVVVVKDLMITTAPLRPLATLATRG